jgi:hypothetical protein
MIKLFSKQMINLKEGKGARKGKGKEAEGGVWGGTKPRRAERTIPASATRPVSSVATISTAVHWRKGGYNGGDGCGQWPSPV